MRTAVIDIGTNTMLLLVVEPGPAGPKAVLDRCRFARLGQGLDRSGHLAGEAIERALAISREFQNEIERLGVTRIAVIATQALREAKNAAEMIAPAESILGARIEIIGGTREAELAHRAVAATFPELAGTPYVVVDVGGGSTEFVSSDGERVTSAVSVPIGAVRLTERHLRGDPATAAEVVALHEDIAHHLEPLALPHGAPIIGTAGTATTMASVELGLAAYDPDKVTGLSLTLPQIQELLSRLLAMPVAARRELPGMVVERADVLPAGVAIFAEAAKKITAPRLTVCDRGIRWGLAFEISDAGAGADGDAG
jgi:exopolyphosphatase/guanosine-5'-triphosphate,3'-diphosphate pyrophosphatase